MKKIKLGITGCLGRMGQQLIKSSKKNNSFKLLTLTESEALNKNFYGIKIQTNSEKAFKDVDVIMSPVSPSAAFDLGSVKDPVSMYLADIYTLSVNLAGLPGMSIPAGFSDNLPVGLQLIGNHWSEELLLNTAHQFQMRTDWHNYSPADR